MALDGDIGCRAIFRNHLEGIVKVPVDDVGILLDIDRQGDFEALRRPAIAPSERKHCSRTADVQGQLVEADS